MAYEMYPWQEACLNKWRSCGTVGCVSAVTGSGKTILALYAIKDLEASLPASGASGDAGLLRVRIVVPTIAIMRQWLRSLRSIGEAIGLTNLSGTEIGCRCGEYKCRSDCKYIVYVVNSARDTLAAQIRKELELGYDVLLIADECHHYYSRENRKIFDFEPLPSFVQSRYHALGLSATPNLPAKDPLIAQALGTILFQYDFREAAVQERISPYAILQIKLHFNGKEQIEYNRYSAALNLLIRRLTQQYPFLRELSGPAFYMAIKSLAHDPANPDETAASFLQTAYKRKELVSLAESRTACLVTLLTILEPTDRVLIFSERIRQADTVYTALLPLFGGQLGRYHSGLSSENNRQTLRAFRDGDLRILISCKALDEGVDVPDANIGIILSGTSVPRQRIQRLGRILRRSEGKAMASLYYLYIAESAEDAAYLPDQELSDNIISLEFDHNDNSFSNELYEQAAIGVLEDLSSESKDALQISEARHCLMEGIALSDWLCPEEVCAQRAAEASTAHLRNYWLCMRRMQLHWQQLRQGMESS